MNEDFVTFDLAKKLKEKGFSCEMPFAMYNEIADFHLLTTSAPYNVCDSGFKYREYYDYEDFDEYDYIAPTISQVLKWLREEKKIFICIDPRFNVLQDKFVYRFYITNLINQDRDSTFEDYNDWETAALEGIEYCLDYLI